MTVCYLGEYMRRQRRWRGWSQSDLAVRVGLRQASISELETGKRVPRLETCQKLADAFDVDIEEIINLTLIALRC